MYLNRLFHCCFKPLTPLTEPSLVLSFQETPFSPSSHVTSPFSSSTLSSTLPTEAVSHRPHPSCSPSPGLPEEAKQSGKASGIQQFHSFIPRWQGLFCVKSYSTFALLRPVRHRHPVYTCIFPTMPTHFTDPDNSVVFFYEPHLSISSTESLLHINWELQATFTTSLVPVPTWEGDISTRRREHFRLWIAALGKTGFNFKTLAHLGDGC